MAVKDCAEEREVRGEPCSCSVPDGGNHSVARSVDRHRSRTGQRQIGIYVEQRRRTAQRHRRFAARPGSRDGSPPLNAGEYSAITRRQATALA